MAMPMTEKKIVGVTSPQVLMFPDHYVAFTYKLSKHSSLAGQPVNGKYIVKAGTLFPSNDDKAVGVILNDYDVTNGDQQAAIVVHGFFSIHKLPEAPVPEAEDALKQISFFPLKTTRINIRYNDLAVGKAGGSLVIEVSGTRFKSVPTVGDGGQLTFITGETGLALANNDAIEMDPSGRTITINLTGEAAAGQASIEIAAEAFVNNKASNTVLVILPNTNRTDTVSDNSKE